MEGLLILIPLALIAVVVVFVWMVARTVSNGQQLDALRGLVDMLLADVSRLKERLAMLETAKPPPPAEAQPPVVTTQPSVIATTTPVAPLPATPPPPMRTIAPLPPPFDTARSIVPPVVPAQPAAIPAIRPVPTLAPRIAPRRPAINWEQFMGVKLFAWIGGFALFLAVAFFVKYSFDNNLVPRELRVAMGFVTGIGLLVGGVLLRRKAYLVTSQTLCATGVVILYAASFAAHGHQLVGGGPAFLLMSLVTVVAFMIAGRLDAQVVAILGLVGGFLTPPLLSTGEDNPLGLFGYVALLDIGLVATALKRRWHYLVAMGVAGTVLMQIGWVDKFFAVDKVFTAMGIFATFNLLFLAAFVVTDRLRQWNRSVSASVLVMPLVTFAFTASFLTYPELGARPGVIFSFILLADLCVLAAVVLRHPLPQVHLVSGGLSFLLLSAWTVSHLKLELLNWQLGACLGFAALHTVFPLVLQRVRPAAGRTWWGHLFPLLALVLTMLPLFQNLDMPWLLWPVVLLIDALAVGLALITGAVVAVVAVLLLTAVVTLVWIIHLPAELTAMPPLLLVVGGFAVFFFLIGSFLGEKILAKWEAAEGGDAGFVGVDSLAALGLKSSRADRLAQIPALSAILPFLLLILATARLPLVSPTPVFGLALLLVVLLLGLTVVLELPVLPLVGLGCVLALEYVWNGAHFTVATAGTTVAWNVVFTAVFIVFPFLFRAKFADRILPWAASALAGPLHFYLVYEAAKQAWPNGAMGLLPAAFAVPMAVALALVARQFAPDAPKRTALLAWFGGSALFFVTLIFPVQFDKQWITVGWALEGAALLWLFHRVPHPGLRAVGVALLVTAFARLALNPAVFDYHPRSETRILNWFLYGYGIVTVCLFAAARLLTPPRNRVFRWNAPPILTALGAVLAFLLVNIEIADWFSTGATLTFEFNANLGQDMTYSLAWGLFAFVVLAAGFKTASRYARYSGMGLLVVTLLKLFLHDLWRLGGLYRIGSLIGLALVLIVVSFIYQRFLAADAANKNAAPPAAT